jgi:hypothetical protein
MQDRTVPKKNSYPRNQRPEPKDRDKRYQLVLDKKAEMDSMLKAMIRSGISFDRVPNEQKKKYLCKWEAKEQLCWDSQEEEQKGQGVPTLPSGSRREGQCF